jgi:hypothetical protein
VCLPCSLLRKQEFPVGTVDYSASVGRRNFNRPPESPTGAELKYAAGCRKNVIYDILRCLIDFAWIALSSREESVSKSGASAMFGQ